MVSAEKAKHMDQLELFTGNIKNPQDHVRWCIDISRCTGKTLKMVKSFPSDKPFAVLVHVHAFDNHIKNLIKEHRPDIDIKNVKFLSYWNESYKIHLRGLKKDMPIFVDNAVLDLVQLEFIKNLNIGVRI